VKHIYKSFLIAVLYLLLGVFTNTTLAQTPPTPIQTYPTGGTTTYLADQPLNWYPSPWAANLTYTVEVYQGTTSGTLKYSQTGDFTSLSTTVTGLFGSTLYTWRVRSHSGGNSSAWATTTFTTYSGLAAPPSPIVTVGDISTTSGASFSVPVRLDLNNSFGSAAYSGTIDYKQSTGDINIAYTGFTTLTGTIANRENMLVTIVANPTAGKLIFVAVGSSAITENDRDTLFNLNFNITGPISNSPDIITPGGFKGDSPTQSSFTYNNGTLTWSTPVTPSTVLGDASGDGTVELYDAILTQQDISAVSGTDYVDASNHTTPSTGGTPPSGALITVMQNRINANANTTAVAGDQILNGDDVTSILNIILGLPPIAPPAANTNLEISYSDFNITGLGQIKIPINFRSSTNLTNGEIKFTYDPNLIDYQSFASQVAASGFYVNSQQSKPGEAYFFFASPSTFNGDFNPGNLILQFKNLSIPVGSQIHTQYRVNGNDWQQGPTLTFSVTGVDDNSSVIPDEFEVSQNYPNPFNPSTIIRYALPEASFVTLKIYNMLGQEVKTLVNEQKNAGTFNVQWRGDNNFGSKVSSGTYIYRVIAGAHIFAKKMILLK